ncbi:50S ribosomal protein L11 methyltransferase [bacterium]|nr:50S ribosomal protein L11 methyltransferase [bacterium]
MRISCEPGFEDVISFLIFESGFYGLEECSGNDRLMYSACYRPTPETPDPLETFRKNLDCLPHAGNTSVAEILSVDEIAEEDWETSWRQGLDAVEIGVRLVIRPSWVPYENLNGRQEIIIDPKMAFGTGGHSTTRLCLEAIERLVHEGITVLDAGCGSGVLSIAAARLGARRVTGFDTDPFSVENARENVLLNGVQDRVTIFEGDLRTVSVDRAELVLANIISGILIPNLDRFHTFLAPHGTVVFSGLLAEEKSLFTDALIKGGFRVRETEQSDEWIAVTAEES